MIKCNSCSKEKKETEFCIRKDGTTGKYRKTCKECKNSNQRKNYKKYKENNPFLARHTKMKASCKQKNIPYDLDEMYLEQIWTGFCPITGVELVWSCGREELKNPNAAELDRFIPSLGYVKGNVSWISRKMNNLKGNGSIKDFKDILDWMKNWTPPKQKMMETKEKKDRNASWNKGLHYSNKEICGENNPTSKLTVQQVKEIKETFSNVRGQYKELSEKYKVSPATIRKIVTNKIWKEV